MLLGQLLWPLAGSLTLTGSFGEIRGQTFHTGIDLSVGEKIGTVPVLAAGDGYVYRLRLSHTGFGKVLYVRHPNGLITVYGHLSHFAPRGEALARALQAAQRRFEVEKYLSPSEWPVRAGDTLGWAGNSGYSFGPHLHFEVRTPTEKPVCPLRYLPPLPDTQPPLFFRLVVVPLTPASHVNGWGERKQIRFRQVSRSPTERRYVSLDTPRVGGPVGLAYTAGDRAGGGTAWLGLARISLYDEQGTCLYQASWETLDFDWRRFLRWHLDYAYQQVYRVGLARLFVREGPAIPWEAGQGVLQLKPGEMRTVEVVAQDFAGHTARLRLTLRGDAPYPGLAPRRPLDPRRPWSLEEGLLLSREPFLTPWGDTVLPHRPLALEGRLPSSLQPLRGGPAQPTYLRACIPPGHPYQLPLSPTCTLHLWTETLQDTLYCQVQERKRPWGPAFFVGDPLVPLRFPAELRWKVPSTGLPQKGYPVFRPEGSTIWSPVLGARLEGHTWRIPVRSWGEYGLMHDTFPPTIRFLRQAGPFYLFSIQDLGSGVNPYALRVESPEGPLYPEYYEPQELLYVPQTAGRPLRITARDRVGNTSHRTFIR